MSTWQDKKKWLMGEWTGQQWLEAISFMLFVLFVLTAIAVG